MAKHCPICQQAFAHEHTFCPECEAAPDLTLTWAQKESLTPYFEEWGKECVTGSAGERTEDFGAALYTESLEKRPREHEREEPWAEVVLPAATPVTGNPSTPLGEIYRAFLAKESGATIHPKPAPVKLPPPPMPTMQLTAQPKEPPTVKETAVNQVHATSHQSAKEWVRHGAHDLWPEQPTLRTAATNDALVSGLAGPTKGRRRWRNIAGGLLGGCCACLLFWSLGLEPPANWRLRGAPAEEKAPEPVVVEDPIQRERTLCLENAFKLAQSQQYVPAVKTLETGRSLATPAPEQGGATESGTDPAADVFLKNCDELVAYWKTEQSLADAGLLSPPQRDPSQALSRLLTGSKELTALLQLLGAKLGGEKQVSDPMVVGQELDRLLQAKENAEKQAARLVPALASARDAREAADRATARAQKLESRLQVSESELRLAQTRFREMTAQREAAAQLRKVEEKPQPPSPPPPVVHDPLLAYQAYKHGLALYQEGRHADAEKEFLTAVRADDEDARYHYFLGLARLSQGKRDLAEESFRRGAQLERDHRPSPVFVTLALEQAPRESLSVLNGYRQ
jgi:TolA-binding protein